MIGKLYGIGAGPGDPELLTLKAINVMEKCDVIAIPKPMTGESAVFSIAREYIQKKELIECAFAMENDMDKRKEARRVVADSIIQFLDKGKDVGFITLGDPTIYSTYMYIHNIIVGMGYKTEIIPGITSYSAAAAALGVALCEDREALVIIPAGNNKAPEELLELPGNKVIMKSGEELARALEKLKELGYGDKIKVATRVTMEGQQLYNSVDDYEKSQEAGYFTVAIVKL